VTLHLTADLKARYQRFLERVTKEREVWVLIDPDMQGAWVESNGHVADNGDPVPVHLVYSAAAYAKQHATGPWAAMEPIAMDLDIFLDGPLKHMHQDGELVSPDFNGDLAGIEVEPIELGLALAGESEL
jgi:Protein of unknown function (DUF2750)